MKPVDIRDMNFERMEATLPPKRDMVWRAWLAYGPRTTRELATLMQIDILAVRPRTTELYECGLVMLADWVEGDGTRAGEGVYRARTAAEWAQWAEEQRRPLQARQLQMI